VRIAFVFPGQASHRRGALTPWQGHPATAVLSKVTQGSGRDVLALAADPQAGERIADAQPAVLAASLVVWQALGDAGIRPDVVAGHGLGEVTAAIAAGVLSVHDGAALVAARGAAMAAVCERRAGGMAAVLRLGRDAVEVIVDGIDDAAIANDNAPGQVVVAGSLEALTQLRDGVRIAGGRLVPLAAEGAFHSPAMAEAGPHVAGTLGRLRVLDPQVPMVSGATAVPLTAAADVANALVHGMEAPVRWREVQSRLVALGVAHLLEIGPGGVLAGLAARAVPELTVHAVATPDDVVRVLDALVPLDLAV
jgi:[acyl-carrier-protein] S-malonyltransferase